jgi:hypothetical protein
MQLFVLSFFAPPARVAAVAGAETRAVGKCEQDDEKKG